MGIINCLPSASPSEPEKPKALRVDFLKHVENDISPCLKKLIFAGNQNSGKTTLCRWLSDRTKPDNVQPTSGQLYSHFNLLINGSYYRFTTWDSGGDVTDWNVTKKYLKGACAIVLAVDQSLPDADETLQKWIDDLSQNAGKEISNVPYIVVGTHCDKMTVFSKETVENLFDRPITYVDFSGKTGTGLDEITKTIAELAYSKEDIVMAE